MSAPESPRAPRSRREERKEETRSELIAAAAKLFARHGYHGVGLEQIAREAGFSTGAIYWHFAGKQDLFLALYEEWVARRVREIRAGSSEQSNLVERARAAADDWMRRLADDPDPLLLRLEFTIRAARDPELRQQLGARAGAVPLAIRQLLEERAEAGARELRLPPDELALALQALSLGLALEALSNPDAVRPGLNGDLAAMLVELAEGPPPRRQ